jgi:hypothetical protein
MQEGERVPERTGGFEEARGFHTRTEGFQGREGSSKDWWFPRRRGISQKDRVVSRRREGSSKEDWWFPRMAGVSQKDRGFSRRREGSSKEDWWFPMMRGVSQKVRGFSRRREGSC